MASYSIQGAGTQSATITSGTYDGLRFSLIATTIGDITNALLQAINVFVTYAPVEGGTYNVVSSNLYALALSDNIGSYELVNIDGTVNCVFNWGGHINLKPGDTLTVTTSVGTTATGLSTYVSTSSSVGIMEYIPTVVVSNVDPNRSNYSFSGGDFVSRIAVVNDSATSISASQKFTSLTIQSDLLNDTFNFGDFQALIAQQWTVDPRSYSFCLHQGTAISRVQINANVNASASATNAWVVVFGGIVTNQTKQRLQATVNKVATQEAAKFLPA